MVATALKPIEVDSDLSIALFLAYERCEYLDSIPFMRFDDRILSLVL